MAVAAVHGGRGGHDSVAPVGLVVLLVSLTPGLSQLIPPASLAGHFKNARRILSIGAVGSGLGFHGHAATWLRLVHGGPYMYYALLHVVLAVPVQRVLRTPEMPPPPLATDPAVLMRCRSL